MSFARVDLKRVLLLVLFSYYVLDSYAQKQVLPFAGVAYEQSGVEQVENLDKTLFKSPLPVDTLRNYTPGGTIFGWWANGTDQSEGWIHGTNFFNDEAKATRLSLPDGTSSATLSEVFVTFIYKAASVTNQTYSIEVREVDVSGAPGNLLWSQEYLMSTINADDDFTTDAGRTTHTLPPGIEVPSQFFVVVNFGDYTSADWENVAIAASPNVGSFVEEDWELLDDGRWINISESWFPDNPNDGWYMWIDAVINTDAISVDPNEPNNTASQATLIQNGYVSSGAAVFPSGDVDYFTFQGTQGEGVDVYARADAGSSLDGVITIYNSAGDFITDNDDFNGSVTESRVTLALPATDTYYIRYAAYDNDTGADFPNKRREGPGSTGELLQSGARDYLTGRSLDSIHQNQLEDTGAYILEFTVTQGVDLTLPVVQHTPASTVVPLGQDIVVQAEATDSDSGIESVLLTSIQGGRGVEGIVINPMVLVSGTTYEGTIPASFVNERGLQYQIAGVDAAGNLGFSDLVNLDVRLEEGLSRSLSITGTDANSYRIISIPISLDNNTVRGVMEDDLGAYDTEKWRFWELLANQMYSEFPGVGPLAPGRAYWFATSQSGQTLTTGPGSTTSLEFFIDLQLNPGWTFVGTPFNFPLGEIQITTESGTAPDIRTFNGSWGTLSGPMMPFQGYAVASINNDVLLINPFIPDATASKGSAPVVANKTGSEYDWAITIKASSGTVVDQDNMIAVSGLASEGWDVLDRPEPPVIGDYLSLYFPHDNWDVPFRHFNTDVRPASDSSQRWTFEVSTNLNDPIELSFEGIENLPVTYGIQLVDRQLHNVQNLREAAQYTFLGREQDLEERFTLVVGTEASVAEELDKLASIPETVELRTYPNPFQSYTTLEFGLPEASEVSVEVYDLLGKRIATLIQGEYRREGAYAIQWDGADASGRPVASGVYVFAIQTGRSRAAQKVVLLR